MEQLYRKEPAEDGTEHFAPLGLPGPSGLAMQMAADYRWLSRGGHVDPAHVLEMALAVHKTSDHSVRWD